jgi:hypothetical protein
VVTQEHAHQLGGVETVALGPPFAPIDLDGSRIDDDVRDVLAAEPAVQPEAIAARLVTTDDGGIVGQAETPLVFTDALVVASGEKNLDFVKESISCQSDDQRLPSMVVRSRQSLCKRIRRLDSPAKVGMKISV